MPIVILLYKMSIVIHPDEIKMLINFIVFRRSLIA